MKKAVVPILTCILAFSPFGGLLSILCYSFANLFSGRSFIGEWKKVNYPITLVVYQNSSARVFVAGSKVNYTWKVEDWKLLLYDSNDSGERIFTGELDGNHLNLESPRETWRFERNRNAVVGNDPDYDPYSDDPTIKEIEKIRSDFKKGLDGQIESLKKIPGGR